MSYLIHGCVEHRSLGGVLKRDLQHCSYLWIVNRITVMTPKVSGLLSWVMTMSMIRMGCLLSLDCTGSVSPLCLSMVRLNHVSFEQSNHMCVYNRCELLSLGDLQQLLYVECLRDDSLLTEEDYAVYSWPERYLCSMVGQVAQPRVNGPEMCSPPGAFFHLD